MNLIRRYAADFACIMLALFLVTVACQTSYLKGKIAGEADKQTHVQNLIAYNDRTENELRGVINLQDQQILVLEKRIRKLQGEE